MKKLGKNAKVVNLVTAKLPPYVSAPWINDYKNPYIVGVRPCIEEDGRYTDLVTGETVVPGSTTFAWGVLCGTVLKYPDGKCYLVSRSGGRERTTVILEEGENWCYSPTSMTMHDVL